MANISQHDAKTTSKVFIICDVLFTNISHFGSSKVLNSTFFWDMGTANTLPTLSHTKPCAQYYLLERSCSFFRPYSKTLHF